MKVTATHRILPNMTSVCVPGSEDAEASLLGREPPRGCSCWPSPDFAGAENQREPTAGDPSRQFPRCWCRIPPWNPPYWPQYRVNLHSSALTAVRLICFLCFRSEQPGDPGAGGKPSERGERRPPGLPTPRAALLSPPGEKPLPHHTTGSAHISAGTECSHHMCDLTPHETSPLRKLCS